MPGSTPDSTNRHRQRQARSDREREWQLQKAAVFPVRARHLFSEIVSFLEADVADFNARCKRDRHFSVTRSNERAVISRTTIPSADLTLSLDITNERINWKRTLFRRSADGHVPSDGWFSIELRNTGDVYALDGQDEPISLRDVSHTLLDPILWE
jgi:hypothetical protein